MRSDSETTMDNKTDMSLDDIIKLNKNLQDSRWSRAGYQDHHGGAMQAPVWGNPCSRSLRNRPTMSGASAGGVRNRPAPYSRPKQLSNKWQLDPFDNDFCSGASTDGHQLNSRANPQK